MTTMASQITSLAVVYSTVYSDTDQRKHQSSSSLAFVWGIHRDRWIPRTKGQLCGKCFHLMLCYVVNNIGCNNNSYSSLWFKCIAHQITSWVTRLTNNLWISNASYQFLPILFIIKIVNASNSVIERVHFKRIISMTISDALTAILPVCCSLFWIHYHLFMQHKFHLSQHYSLQLEIISV